MRPVMVTDLTGKRTIYLFSAVSAVRLHDDVPQQGEGLRRRGPQLEGALGGHQCVAELAQHVAALQGAGGHCITSCQVTSCQVM